MKKTKEYLKNGGTVPDLQQLQQQNPFISGIGGPANLPNNNLFNANNGNANQNQQIPNPPFYPAFNPMGGFGGFGFPNPQAQVETQRVMDENLYKEQLKEL